MPITASVEAARSDFGNDPLGQARLPLGSVLLRDRLLTPDQLEEALAEKERTGNRLGEIIVQRGWVAEAEVARIVADQHGLEYIDLVEARPDPEAALLLPQRYAQRYCAVPVRLLPDGDLLVAIWDPTDIASADELRLAVARNIRFAVADRSAIERILAGVAYDDSAELDVGPDGDMPSGDEPDRQRIDVEESASAPAVLLVNAVLAKAINRGASDIHFEPQSTGIVVRARIDGVMQRLRVVPRHMAAAVTSRLKVMAELDIAERRAPQDGRASIEFNNQPMDLRIAVLPTTYGEQVVVRVVNRTGRAMGLAELGMSAQTEAIFRRAINQPYGAVLAVGPTGSGKTTTLYAALDSLNTDDRVIITIEDPVELRVPGVNQVEVHARGGLSFEQGLRTVLRSDPDVLLVGECRDSETARIAFQAALTGHLVLTTLHTHNAASSIERLKDMGVPPSLLATTINCIVAQRLARRLCQACKEPYEPDAVFLHEAGFDEHLLGGSRATTLYRASSGCTQCSHTGYDGRVAMYEILEVRGKIRRLVEASSDEIFAAAVSEGMRTLRQDALRLCLAGQTSLDELRRVTGDRMT